MAYLGLSFFLPDNLLPIRYASEPLIRITASPPIPSGVAREAIVVFKLEGGKTLTGEVTPSFLLRFAPLWG